MECSSKLFEQILEVFELNEQISMKRILPNSSKHCYYIDFTSVVTSSLFVFFITYIKMTLNFAYAVVYFIHF